MRSFFYGQQQRTMPVKRVSATTPKPTPVRSSTYRAAVVENLERREFLSGSTFVTAPFVQAEGASADQALAVPYAPQAMSDGVAPTPVRRSPQASAGRGLVETKVFLREATFAGAAEGNGPSTHAAATRALSTADAHSYAGRPPKPLPKPRLESPPKDTKGSGQPKLLLIEDDATSRNALTILLRRRGWDVIAVATVGEGITALGSDPDRVIVDLKLPDGEGEAILRQVRSAHLHARVTVMTGVDDPARLERARELGAAAVLQKPVNLAELLAGLSDGGTN